MAMVLIISAIVNFEKNIRMKINYLNQKMNKK